MRERGLLLTKDLRVKSANGEKTKTRRLCKQPLLLSTAITCTLGYDMPSGHWFLSDQTGQVYDLGKPQYQVGDHLYLQEPYVVQGVERVKDVLVVKYLDDESGTEWEWKNISSREMKLWLNRKCPFRKTSSRFMYKSLARTWFEVTGVMVERLQDISEADAIAEGVVRTGGGRYWIAAFDQGFTPRANAREAFFDLWDSCNKIKAKQNPWVFPFTYNKIESR